MTTSHLKTGVEPTPETSCISNIPQTIDSVQHSVLKLSLKTYKFITVVLIIVIIINSNGDSRDNTLNYNSNNN
jgi:hypothetical protein